MHASYHMVAREGADYGIVVFAGDGAPGPLLLPPLTTNESAKENTATMDQSDVVLRNK